MAEDGSAETAYEHVTHNHEEIRRWVRQRGGRPAKRRDAPDADAGDVLAVSFPDTDDESLDPIEWEEFFERFESGGLAFAHGAGADGSEPDFALVDREEAEDAGDGRPAVEERRTGAGEESRESESRAEAREREAMDEANADGHRDEPPFTS